MSSVTIIKKFKVGARVRVVDNHGGLYPVGHVGEVLDDCFAPYISGPKGKWAYCQSQLEPAEPEVSYNGMPIVINHDLAEEYWRIHKPAPAAAANQAPPPSADCTCIALLAGHSPGCPYPRRSA